jgi:antirestriction protein ArdC
MATATKTLDQFNYFTGHKYQGQNVLDLAGQGYKSNQWATYNQWFSNGYQVQKGQHGTGIMLVKKDDDSTDTVVRWYKVFNFEQVKPMEVNDEG